MGGTKFLGRIVGSAGLSPPLVLGVGSRLWTALSWIVTLRLIATSLSPTVQGYYFTFSSLSQMTQLVDLGLQVLIVQFASHEAAHLAFGRKGAVSGAPAAMARLSSLGRFSLTWYTAGSLILAPAMVAAGPWLFGAGGEPGWRGPWMALSGLVAVDLILNNFVWLLEGTNNLLVVYSYRLLRGVVMAAALWIFLALGLGLWSIPLSLLAAVSVMIGFLMIARPQFVRFFFARTTRGSPLTWRGEILALQWRVGVSAISGFAISYLMVPVTFKISGAVAAGRLGFTCAIIQGMVSVALLWPAVTFPSMGALAARRNWAELDRVTLRVGSQAVLLTVLAAAAIVAFVIAVDHSDSRLAERLLDIAPVSIFALAQVPFTLQAVLVYYLRAHRKEPIVYISGATGLAMLAAYITGAEFYGPSGVVVGYALVMAFGAFPATVWLARRCRATWHAASAEESPLSAAAQCSRTTS